jgi:acylphosphatase
MRRVAAKIAGRVQGVGFRASTAREARALGLTGWVANRADGTVVLEAQGDAAAIDALVAWCGRGPPAARVTGVVVEERAPVVGEVGFAQR